MMSEWRQYGLNPNTLKAYFEERVNILTEKKNSTRYSKRKDATDVIRKLGSRLLKLADILEPLISSLLLSSPQYAIPYTCLKIILKVFISSTLKKLLAKGQAVPCRYRSR